jgi:hypothetical protein
LHHFHPFLNTLPITSGEIYSHGPDSLAQQFYTGLLHCSNWGQTWSPAKSCLEYSCFKWAFKGKGVQKTRSSQKN